MECRGLARAPASAVCRHHARHRCPRYLASPGKGTKVQSTDPSPCSLLLTGIPQGCSPARVLCCRKSEGCRLRLHLDPQRKAAVMCAPALRGHECPGRCLAPGELELQSRLPSHQGSALGAQEAAEHRGCSSPAVLPGQSLVGPWSGCPCARCPWGGTTALKLAVPGRVYKRLTWRSVPWFSW